jgi:hypothetical protein
MMTRGTINNWTPWCVDEPVNKVICQICGNSSIKKNVKILSHLRYANRNDKRNTSVKVYKMLEENPIPRDIKMSSSLYYGRTKKCETHVIVFFHNTRKKTF